MTPEYDPHPQNVRKLWRLAEDVLNLDLTSANLITELQRLQSNAENVLHNKNPGRGNRFNLAKARQQALENRRLAAVEYAGEVKRAIDLAKSRGAKTAREIGLALDTMGVKPRYADKWSPALVLRMIKKP